MFRLLKHAPGGWGVLRSQRVVHMTLIDDCKIGIYFRCLKFVESRELANAHIKFYMWFCENMQDNALTVARLPPWCLNWIGNVGCREWDTTRMPKWWLMWQLREALDQFELWSNWVQAWRRRLSLLSTSMVKKVALLVLIKMLREPLSCTTPTSAFRAWINLMQLGILVAETSTLERVAVVEVLMPH